MALIHRIAFLPLGLVPLVAIACGSTPSDALDDPIVIAALQELQAQAAAHANDPSVPGGCFAANLSISASRSSGWT